MPRGWKQARLGASCVALVFAACVMTLTGCSENSKKSSLPKGASLYGDGASLREILHAFESLQGTPLAGVSHAVRERIADCDQVVAQTDLRDVSNWLERARCASPGDVPAAIRELRGEGAAGFSIEVEPGQHLTGKLVRTDDGALALEAFVDAPDARNFMALLIPGEESPGPPSLSEAETLVHARMRPLSGLNVASLVAEDSQADSMFKLRSELFLGQVLAGTWEVAIYLPREDQVTPPIALALDYSLRPAAKAAMETFVEELESTWPIHHSEMSTGGFTGACFHDVRLLPDLAPCYVVTDKSIVVGWNATSLDLALGLDSSANTLVNADAVDTVGLGSDGGLVFHLGRLPEADALLQQQIMGEKLGSTRDYVWDALRVRGANDGSTVEVNVSLLMEGQSS